MPEYEQGFLWDHTYKLRKRERRREISYGSVRAGYEPQYSSRERRNSGNLNEKQRPASSESIRSAPSTEDIVRRRRVVAYKNHANSWRTSGKNRDEHTQFGSTRCCHRPPDCHHHHLLNSSNKELLNWVIKQLQFYQNEWLGRGVGRWR